MERPQKPSQIFEAVLAGDGEAQARLLPLLYEDLRGIAARHLRGERADHTLQPTALVHEAWLRMTDGTPAEWRGKTQFFAMAATMMRRILVDHARARRTRKRGGDAGRISLSEIETASVDDRVDVLALDEALAKLTSESPRQARVVELRFFGGLSLEETAAALGVSLDVVKADWRFARAVLNRELTRDRSTE